MRCFFGHKWKEINRIFNNPVLGLKHVRGGEPGQADRIILGFTSIEQRCEKCGMISFTETLGNHVKP